MPIDYAKFENMNVLQFSPVSWTADENIVLPLPSRMSALPYVLMLPTEKWNPGLCKVKDGRVTVTIIEADFIAGYDHWKPKQVERAKKEFRGVVKMIRRSTGKFPASEEPIDLLGTTTIDPRLIEARIIEDTPGKLVVEFGHTPIGALAVHETSSGFVFDIEAARADLDLTRMFFNNLLRPSHVDERVVASALLHDENGPLGDLVARYRLVAASSL